MASLMSTAFNIIFGLFWTKARSSLGNRLKDGDLNSEAFRNVIVSKLENVKTKLDGLARRELLSSLSFIQEGLVTLGDLLDKQNASAPASCREEGEGDASAKEESKIDSATGSNRGSWFKWVVDPFKRVFSGNGVRNSSLASSEKDNKSTTSTADVSAKKRRGSPESDKSDFCADNGAKLVEAIKKLKIISSDHFASAIESFKNANVCATKAFHDEGLSIEDRVLAARLRVQSRLLISLENPDLANTCKLYLEELHGLPNIVEIFRTFLEGGVLSYLNKAKRQELVVAVSEINFVVFQFLKSCTEGARVNVYNWPLIKRDEWSYNPLLPDKTVFTELEKSDIEVPGHLVLLKRVKPTNTMRWRSLWCHKVNANGERDLFLFLNEGIYKLKCGRSKFELVYECEHFDEEENSFGRIDAENFLYFFIATREESTGVESLRRECYIQIEVLDPLKLQKAKPKVATLTFHNSFHILTPTPKNFQLAVCCSEKLDDTAKLKVLEIEIKGMDECQMDTTITDNNEVVAVESEGYLVRVFDKEGRLMREFELYGGPRETCKAITFNSLTKEVLVVSRVEKMYYLSTYLPETGKRCHHMWLSHVPEGCREFHLTSHCSGSIVLITDEHILYIQ